MKKIIFLLLILTGYSVNSEEMRNYVDQPDVDDGYNIHIIYALPSDGIDKKYDLNNQISMLAHQMDKWFNTKTKDRLFPEGQHLKFDRKDDGRIDITFLK